MTWPMSRAPSAGQAHVDQLVRVILFVAAQRQARLTTGTIFQPQQ